MVEQETASGEKKKGSFTGLIRKIADKGHQIMTEKADKSKNEAYLKRLEKYNPVYAAELESGEFYMPNMLFIEDDSKRREADVLEEAIGWRTKEKGAEVFHLFEDMVEQMGFVFLPNLQCNAFYYVDCFDKSKFLRVDCVFAIVRDEKLAELKHIACCLGAKKCTIEMAESHTNVQNMKNEGKFKFIKGSEERSKQKTEQNFGKLVVEFEGSKNPTRPTLKWFAHDQNVINLIDARCSGVNGVKNERVELYGAMSSAMSQKTACEIDTAIIKTGGKAKMESQAIAENESKLIYSIEF